MLNDKCLTTVVKFLTSLVRWSCRKRKCFSDCVFHAMFIHFGKKVLEEGTGRRYWKKVLEDHGNKKQLYSMLMFSVSSVRHFLSG